MIDHAPFLNFGETYSTNSSDTKNSPSSKYVKSIHLKEMISMCPKFFESPSNKQIYALEQGRSYTFQNEGARLQGGWGLPGLQMTALHRPPVQVGNGLPTGSSIPSPPPSSYAPDLEALIMFYFKRCITCIATNKLEPLWRMRTPVREAFSYGIRHGILIVIQ